LEAYFLQDKRYSDLFEGTDFSNNEDSQLILNYHSILRFLVSSYWDFDASIDRIKEWIVWRRGNKPHLYKPIKECIEANYGYTCGRDKMGRPIGIVKASNYDVNKRDLEKVLANTIFFLEQAIKYMPDPVNDQYILVYDCQHIGLNNVDISFGNEISLITKHYPSRIGKYLIINPSPIWKSIFNLISHFFSSEDLKKS